jgi:hypothetical protein
VMYEPPSSAPARTGAAVIRNECFRQRVIELDLATLHCDASPRIAGPRVMTKGAAAVPFIFTCAEQVWEPASGVCSEWNSVALSRD